MTIWLLAVLVGLVAAALQYGARALDLRVAPLAALRALAVALVVALLLGAPGGRSTPLAPEVALDAIGELAARRTRLRRVAAPRSTRASRVGGTRLRFGDSLRVDRSTAARRPIMRRVSAPSPTARRVPGIPVVVITDGELEDADALASLPRGSRAHRHALPRRARPRALGDRCAAQHPRRRHDRRRG